MKLQLHNATLLPPSVCSRQCSIVTTKLHSSHIDNNGTPVFSDMCYTEAVLEKLSFQGSKTKLLLNREKTDVFLNLVWLGRM